MITTYWKFNSWVIICTLTRHVSARGPQEGTGTHKKEKKKREILLFKELVLHRQDQVGHLTEAAGL